uniref:Uncharacterized protein n=1 Tax=Trichogramma kaykai TaxID=54128 RepID=A0ABD2XM66_9HYME
MSHFDMCGRLLTNSEWSSFWWELAWGSMELLKHGFMTSPVLYVGNNEEKMFRFELHKSLAVDAVNPQAGRPCVRLILSYLNRASLPCRTIARSLRVTARGKSSTSARTCFAPTFRRRIS